MYRHSNLPTEDYTRGHNVGSGSRFRSPLGRRLHNLIILFLIVISIIWLSVVTLYFRRNTSKNALNFADYEAKTVFNLPSNSSSRDHVPPDSVQKLDAAGLAIEYPDRPRLVTGPMLVRPRARREIQYPDADPEHMHGRLGLNAQGEPLWQPNPEPVITNMAFELRNGGGFNLKLSDALPLDRVATDNRQGSCRKQVYALNELPTASVVIVFYNEPFSTLMRSVHSVLNRTPPELLEEIILVDDGSTHAHIYSGNPETPSFLQSYIQTLPKTRLIRNPTRTGIVGARLLGITNAVSEVFVILDSHIEVQPQWLEPLVYRIKQDRRFVIMPMVDGINPETFTYNSGGVGCTLGFIWKLMEHSFTPDGSNPRRSSKADDLYVESPTMAGGLFAAHKQLFLDIGAYDTGMAYWGAENVEFSFRLWQCGAVLECSYCSRVYHIFRKGGSGYSVPDPHALTRNKLRLMAVWMDEYADLAWQVLDRPNITIGDISSRVALRKELNCKPFSYFLNDVWPESQVHSVPQDVPFLGRLENVGTGLCLAPEGSYTGASLKLKPCSHASNMMYFRTTKRITPTSDDELCVGLNSRLEWCEGGAMDSIRWTVTPARQITLTRSWDGLFATQCLSARQGNSAKHQTPSLEVVPCKSVQPDQRLRGNASLPDEASLQLWNWEEYRPSWKSPAQR